MSHSGLDNLRELNRGYEEDVAALQANGKLALLRKTLRMLRGNSKEEKLKMFREAEPFRMMFGVSSDRGKSDIANLSYHLDNIKPSGLISAAKAYLAWMCVYYRESAGEAERFYFEAGIATAECTFRKFNGNPRSAYGNAPPGARGDKLGYLDNGLTGRVYNQRDWEIASHRILEEKRLKTGRLSLSKLRIDSLPEAVLDMTWLTSLHCSVTLITSLPEFSSLSHLEMVDFSYSPVDTLPNLSKFPSLKVAFLGVSNIESLSGLSGCKNLKEVFCGSTPISSLEDLRLCENLEGIHCEDTWINSLSGLEGCSNI